MRILEIKSMERLPDAPYASHETQVQGQVGLLHKLWNKPVFSLRSSHGTILHEKVTFPQLCKAHFGLTFPNEPQNVSLEGWLLCLSMKETRAFGPYVYDAQSLQNTLDCAHNFWVDLQGLQNGSMSLTDTSYAQGFYLLCGSCAYNADCPKFKQGKEQPQWNESLVQLDDLKSKCSALECEIKRIEAALRQAHQLSGTQDWISTGDYRFRTTTTAGRRTLDRASLQEELDEICAFEKIEPIDAEALLRRHEREGAPICRLTITALK